jgi:hypothetical protein
MNFKNKFSLKNRVEESSRILLKYPDRVPIICEKNNRYSGVELEKKKYLNYKVCFVNLIDKIFSERKNENNRLLRNYYIVKGFYILKIYFF